MMDDNQVQSMINSKNITPNPSIKNPLISIGIPTFNRANHYLKETLESAVRQTYRNIEIIVSDNGSLDNTEEVVRSFSDSRIKYFKHPKNIGASNNFNFCIKQAVGTYILLLPDDDLIDDDFVEVCVKAANFRTDIGIIRTGMRRINEAGDLITENPNYAVNLSTVDFIMKWFEYKIPMHLCMTLFNTHKLIEIGGLNSKHQLFNDVLAEVQLAAKYGRVDIQDVKASFRMHSQQFTFSKKINAWCEDSFQLLDKIYDIAPEKKKLLKKKGMEFFFRHNYNMAKKNKSIIGRWIATLMVYKKFGFRYLSEII